MLSLKKKHSLSSSSSICFKILSLALLLQQSNCHLCLLSQSSTSTWFMQSCWGWIDIYVLKRSYWSVNSSPNLLNPHAQAPRKRYIYIYIYIESKHLNSCIVLLLINYFLKGYWTSQKSVLIKFHYVEPNVSALSGEGFHCRT